MARAGMVNIDDITDTKHLPAVEVKPFTNDHRPLADLVRETPAKVLGYLRYKFMKQSFLMSIFPAWLGLHPE